MPQRKPNLLVILIDDLRYDEFGAGGHPYMVTPNIDRLAREGALFERAFHTTPICSPNRASIVTGQYASRHGIIDNVARDAMSHRLPNYHLDLQKLGYETAHIGKWHMGNDGMPRPGYDHWVSYDGHGRLMDPVLNHDGRYRTQVYEGLPAGDKALLWLEGADHASFGGGTGMPVPAMRRRDAAVLATEPAHQSLIAGMTALWWRWRLSNDATAEETLRALAHGQVAGGLGPVVAPDRFMVG